MPIYIITFTGIIQKLVDHHADIDANKYWEQTPLCIAARLGSEPMMR